MNTTDSQNKTIKKFTEEDIITHINKFGYRDDGDNFECAKEAIIDFLKEKGFFSGKFANTLEKTK